jgi:hypothetical protein
VLDRLANHPRKLFLRLARDFGGAPVRDDPTKVSYASAHDPCLFSLAPTEEPLGEDAHLLCLDIETCHHPSQDTLTVPVHTSVEMQAFSGKILHSTALRRSRPSIRRTLRLS